MCVVCIYFWSLYFRYCVFLWYQSLNMLIQKWNQFLGTHNPPPPPLLCIFLTFILCLKFYKLVIRFFCTLIVWLPCQIEWIKVKWEIGWVLVCLDELFSELIALKQGTEVLIRKIKAMFIGKGKHFNCDEIFSE